MSVIAVIFVKHDFFELDNYKRSEEFVKSAIDNVKRVLSINKNYDHCEFNSHYVDDDKWSLIDFEIPLLDVSVNLRKGYWSVCIRFNYCQVTNKLEGRLHLIDKAYDLAKALGGNVVWLSDEFMEDDKRICRDIELGRVMAQTVHAEMYRLLERYDNRKLDMR